MTVRGGSVFVGWVAVMAALVVAARLAPSAMWASIFDNLQWTFAFGGSAWLAWRGLAGARVIDRPLRIGLFAGALMIFAGQLVWMVQVASGWNPFPAPADAVFLLAPVAWAAGWLAALVRGLPRERLLPSLLDIGGAMSALMAAVLTLYFPSGADLAFGSLIVLALYPVLFLLAAGLAVLVVPALQLRPDRFHLLVLVGTTTYGLSWMHWNLLALEDALVPGSLFNAAFTLSAVLFGLGACRFRIEADLRGDECWRERTMAYLPLAAMALALLSLVLLFLRSGDDAGVAQRVIFACCLLALTLTTVRQTLVVGVLERLRNAENAILRNEAQMYRLANFDTLTELPNRRLFEDRLEHSLREAALSGGQVAVLLIDLDHFKQVNDTFGHRFGDRLLRETAMRLQSCLRSDATLARMGGDEFMVMVERMHSRTDVAALAQALLDRVDCPWADAAMAQQIVGASIGISLYPDDAANAVELIRNADSALNEAKSAGRGTYRFYIEAYTEVTRRKLELRNRLRLARPDLEFHVVYQPQYDALRNLVGLEALLRWTVDGAPVPPDEFIPIAEESGLIVAIGEWVLETTCRQILAWRAQGRWVPPVSVNVSARQLIEAEIAQRYAQIVHAAGVAAADLVLEVTETQLLEDRMLPSVEALSRAGFKLSMDDFGTGQSSLVKLKLLPITELKIDKAFVRDIATDAGDREICATIHALAITLGLEVVAEGVETEDQFELLVGMGCQRFQGWLFAPAMLPSAVSLPSEAAQLTAGSATAPAR
ncbi:putative bifunctional diguanylate cyclase/phosphodiesterase [Thauera mechernichensis]|uniref:Bifunctional diguanylate cyclase/phosphodiesterase n=1 Tax=Thauera mechernichensis TaxID=82788 RepID=A0ABW3WCB9_9RHOO|nr:EAL domain-containing protein [Thauera mechernichensis]MDG3065687.1 EAL domain-containing protein [Thauera mechernichensis]